MIDNNMRKIPFVFGKPPCVPKAAFLDTKSLKAAEGNTGNVAFRHAIFSHLGGNLNVIGWSEKTDIVYDESRIGVIPAANQFGAHTDYQKLSDHFDTISAKVVMIGLGAQANLSGDLPDVGAGTVSWISAIQSLSPTDAPNITLRGPFTKRALEKYGLHEKAIVMGCPSLFINPDPELGLKIEKASKPSKRIAVAAGNPYWRRLNRIETSLARMVSATNGTYVVQQTEALMHLGRGEANLIDRDERRRLREYICPEMNTSEFIDWSQRYAHIFFDVESWIEHYRRFSCVIGARIHGVMLALQAGIPGICVAHDSRTLEMCQVMKVPHLVADDHLDGISRATVDKIVQSFDGRAFDENRRALAKRYVEFLESNELTPVNWLKDIAAPA